MNGLESGLLLVIAINPHRITAALQDEDLMLTGYRRECDIATPVPTDRSLLCMVVVIEVVYSHPGYTRSIKLIHVNLYGSYINTVEQYHPRQQRHWQHFES